jgi:hypothetical protein
MFWSLDMQIALNIGGHPECGDVDAFIEYLRQPA